MRKNWQEAPGELPRLDIEGLLSRETIEQRMPSPEDVVTSTTAPLDDVRKCPSWWL